MFDCKWNWGDQISLTGLINYIFYLFIYFYQGDSPHSPITKHFMYNWQTMQSYKFCPCIHITRTFALIVVQTKKSEHSVQCKQWVKQWVTTSWFQRCQDISDCFKIAIINTTSWIYLHVCDNRESKLFSVEMTQWHKMNYWLFRLWYFSGYWMFIVLAFIPSCIFTA